MADYDAIVESIDDNQTPWKPFYEQVYKLVIEEGVTYIGVASLAVLPVEEIIIPNSVTEIADQAFYLCLYAGNIVIGDGVTKIGERAFYLSGLLANGAKITIGQSVNYIGDHAFIYSELSVMTCKGSPFETWVNPPAASSCNLVVGEDVWEDWITAYPDLADGIHYTGESKSWTSGDCTVTLSTDNTITVSGNGEMADYSSTDDVPWMQYGTKVRKVTFKDGVTKIGRNAFANFTTVANVYIESDLTTWEGCARDFWNKTTFHFTTDQQWYRRFFALINRSCEMDCGGGIAWTYDKENKTLKFYPVNDQATGRMNDYDEAEEKTETAKGVPAWDYLIDMNQTVDTISLDWGVRYIGAYAFCNSPAQVIKQPATLEDCGEGAFKDSKIWHFDIPSTMTTIPDYMFAGAPIDEAVIPDGVTSIGKEAFKDCQYLKTVFLPRSVTSIGAEAFNGLDDNIDVYSYIPVPGSITWPNTATEFGTTTLFHVLPGQKVLWQQAFPSLRVHYIEDTYGKNHPIELKTAADWRYFRNLVNNGTQPIYVKLMNDIDLGYCDDLVGTSEYPFNGFFDGQGYTLTINSDELDVGNDYHAPFSHIGGATIRNLRVNGTQRNYFAHPSGWSGSGTQYSRIMGSQWCGGIVGEVSGDGNVIEGCTMSGKFYYGDMYNGGIVGRVAAGASLDIRNVLFNGQLVMGDKFTIGIGYPKGFLSGVHEPNNSSAFVGSNEGQLNMESCYFSGSANTRGWNDSYVFVGFTSAGATTTLTDCYYKSLGNTLKSQDGSTDASQLTARQVDDRLGAMWRIGSDGTSVLPRLIVAPQQGEGTSASPYLIATESDWCNFIYHTQYYGDDYDKKFWKQTADITTTKWGACLIGSASTHNTYDGDQHTLTIDVESVKPFTAPFLKAELSTIKSLKVKGSLKGGIHSAGLLGQSFQNNLIEDCLVDVNVTFGGNSTNNAHGGGFVGHAKDSELSIKNCLFHGTLTAEDNGISDGTWAGTIVEWGEADATLILNNCFALCQFANVQYADFYWLNNESATNHQPATGAQLTDCCYTDGQTADAAKVTLIGSPDIVADITPLLHTSYATFGLDFYRLSDAHCYLIYDGKAYMTEGTLFDNIDNTKLIEAYKGSPVDITILGRTLYKDGSWNTICLPFALSSLTDTPLEGATVKTLSSATFADGTLTLNFSSDLTATEAGKPYIVKWESGDDIVDPVFNNVTISSTEPTDVEGSAANFHGIFSPYATGGKNTSMLYLGADNTLYYPNADMTIGAFRAYFRLADDITAGDLPQQARRFVLNFGDEATGILTTDLMDYTDKAGAWYDMQGRRLTGKPSRKGIYINNGKKITIK